LRILPRRSKVVGALRVIRMKLGHLFRGTPHPAPVGRPDYYSRELDASLFIRHASGLQVRQCVTPGYAEDDPRDVARRCHDRYGVYPLNFSFPTARVPRILRDQRPHFLSTTYPGAPHSFSNWEDYLEEYRASYFALSTKKGGWDTFRHLEILFSGAIPLMPNLGVAHPFALAHYPKKLLTSVLHSQMREGPALPDDDTREFLATWAKNHLTTQAMAQYLVDVSGMAPDRVLFVDTSLASRTDYLSAFTFIGLSEVLGSALVAAFEPSYLFDDFTGDTSRFYGKGFGYTRVVPASLRSQESLSVDAPIRELLALASSASAIVVGNYDANLETVGDLLAGGVSPDKIVCVLGSDLPPDRSLLGGIRRSGMTFFVREFAS
jgi:hypothetical protein